MRAADVLRDAGRPIAYHAGIARTLRSIPAALMLSQLIYWTDKTADEDGWVWKIEQDWEDELALTPEQLRGARSLLTRLGLIDHRRAGMPARPYYRVNMDTLDLWWEQSFPQRQSGQNARTRPGITTQQGGAKCPDTPLLDIDDVQEKTPKIRNDRRSSFPDAFHLTTEMRAWAAKEVPGVDLSFQTRQFADHWRGKGEKRADWVATWRMWMRNAGKWSTPSPTPGRSSTTTYIQAPTAGADAVMAPDEYEAWMDELEADRAKQA